MIVLKIQRFAESRGIENGNQLAVKTGLPSKRAWEIWNEQAVPTLATLDQLCTAFGCGLDDLVFYVEGDGTIHWAQQNDPLLTGKRAKGRAVRKVGTKARSR